MTTGEFGHCAVGAHTASYVRTRSTPVKRAAPGSVVLRKMTGFPPSEPSQLNAWIPLILDETVFLPEQL